MLAKRTLATISLVAAVCLGAAAQQRGNVVVLQTELQNISGSAWLSNHIQGMIEENVQKYTDFTTVVDEAAERKVKEQQRRSESTAHSESDIIEIGKLVNAKHAVFSSVRKAGSAYVLSIDFTDLTTGVHRASITSRQYESLERLYARPGAVDEVTLALCERLGIALSAAQRYVLQHGEGDLSVSQQLELEKKEQERFREQMKSLDAQISALKLSTKADAEAQQKKLEALAAINEQKMKAAQEREQRLAEEQRRREADLLAEAGRKEASIQRRNSMIEEVERKVKDVRSANRQDFNMTERLAFLETKKKTFLELEEEYGRVIQEIDAAAEKETAAKMAEIDARPWRAAELSGGKPSLAAQERREHERETVRSEVLAKAEAEKSAVEKELRPKSDALLLEIVDDYRFLEKTAVTISSLKNEKELQYSIGAFDGNRNAWPIFIYFYNDGKESIGQWQTEIAYQPLTGKKPDKQQKSDYDGFLDTVDLYNSMFARSEAVLTLEADYVVEPWDDDEPSQYKIRFRELRIRDTMSGKVLQKEAIQDLDKMVAFPPCEIAGEHYARVVSPKSKNVPAYILYELAFADDVPSFNLLRRAAAQGYAYVQYWLGWLYANGSGVPQDYAKAREWYEKAAAQGDADAQHELGWLYEYGFGVRQDYAKAREWYEKAAAQGNAGAQCNLGRLYDYGLGVVQDYAKALEWYEKSAAQEDASAQAALGMLYRDGEGVRQDYVKAREWYEKAAAQGDASAQAELGWLYYNGNGVRQDYARAREWLEKAAAQGFPPAQNNLGWLYANGSGVPQDYAKAREWYEKAAAQGLDFAQNNLGWLYENGKGVRQDYVKAREWYEKAAAQGTEYAIEALKRLKGK